MKRAIILISIIVISSTASAQKLTQQEQQEFYKFFESLKKEISSGNAEAVSRIIDLEDASLQTDATVFFEEDVVKSFTCDHFTFIEDNEDSYVLYQNSLNFTDEGKVNFTITSKPFNGQGFPEDYGEFAYIFKFGKKAGKFRLVEFYVAG